MYNGAGKYLVSRRSGQKIRLRMLGAGVSRARVITRFLKLFRLALYRAFQHDAFAVAKASAYSCIFTFFLLC